MSLDQFKAFERFSLRLSPGLNVLVGPNNAGKSTAISALKAVAAMLRISQRERASESREDEGVIYRVHQFATTDVGLLHENLRYDFQPRDVSILARFDTEVALRAVWPADEQQVPFFYLKRTSAPLWREIKALVDWPELAVIPVLTPVEDVETVLGEKYVLRNLGSRLASRHFRNQLYLLRPDWNETSDPFEEFREFARPWLPEVVIERPTTRTGERGLELDVYYTEGHRSREIVWAGDGLQVYIQLLLQVFWMRSADVLILDEPDVYLHADLQRRLIRLLLSLDRQVILSTHSTEMVAEAPPEAVVWVDKSRRKAVRGPGPLELTELSDAIGSAFNLQLARVLRAKLAVFVEGKDMSILRVLAARAGFSQWVAETQLVVVPLEGSANWRLLEGFRWLYKELLRGAVKGLVILDRDYRSDDAANGLERDLRAAGLDAHVWRRHELESYVLAPALMARVADVSTSEMEGILRDVTDELRDVVLAGLTEARFTSRSERHRTVGPIAAACATELRSMWPDLGARLAFGPAKEILAATNRRLQSERKPTLSARRLAAAMQADEIPDEMLDVFRTGERLISGARR